MSTRRRRAHFPVEGGPFGRPRETRATVTIAGELFAVRPLGRRRTFELPLATVAKMVFERVVKRELFEKRLEKARLRKLRRGR